MKLRIRGNSIRLRLTRGEVEKFAAAGRVEEQVDFGPGKRKFIYALETAKDGGTVFADYEGDRLCVHVPEAAAREWAGTEKVGIESNDAGGLRILIEKDFACLSPRPGEDESDMFAIPESRVC